MAFTVLVTGATGFIGYRLALDLIASGIATRAIGRSSTRLQALAQHGCETMAADLRIPTEIREACRGIDVVCHLGALSAPWGRKEDFLACNVEGTRNVLEACRSESVGRCVYVSSPSVTSGAAHLLQQTEFAPFASPAISAYSHSKQLAEQIARTYIQQNLPVVILRPKAVFGPGDTSLLPRLLQSAAEGRLRPIGSGNNRVDLTYVDNVVHSIRLAMEADAALGKTYVITNDEHPLLWQVISDVCAALELPFRHRPIPYRVALAAATMFELRARISGKEPMLTRYAVKILSRDQTYDISAAKRDLGYQPLVSLEEGIVRTLADLRQQSGTAIDQLTGAEGLPA